MSKPLIIRLVASAFTAAAIMALTNCGDQSDGKASSSHGASSSTAGSTEELPKVRTDRPIAPGGLPQPSAAASPAHPSSPADPSSAAAPAASPARSPHATSGSSPGADPASAGTANRAVISADGKSFSVLGLTMPKPATWADKDIEPHNRGMRVANFMVPGMDGGDQAELVIFRFEGDRGTKQMNIDRWVGQFRGTDQQPVKPIIEELQVDGMPVTIVELSGDYLGMGTTGLAHDQLFFGAIVEASAGKVYARLVGDRPTIEANREAFATMLKGLRKTEIKPAP